MAPASSSHLNEVGAPNVAAVVFNPIKVNLKSLRAAVAREEKDAGWGETLWLETSEKDPGGGQAKQALERGAAVVIAAGGDGTVRAVAEALRGSGIPIALLPSGTGNLLARNLSLALDDHRGSVRAAFAGIDRAIDVGVVEAEREDGSRDSHAFLVMAGVGLDAQMLANTRPELKKRVGWLAYIDGIVRSTRMHTHNSVRVRYQVDGQPVKSATVNTILVGNCGTLPANILLLPDAVIDDGIFDIVALRPTGLIGWAQIWVKIVWENGVLRRSSVGRKLITFSREVRTLRYLKGSELVLRLEHPEEFELDGDPFGEAIALKARVDHLALLVRIPANSEIDP
jgi:diacylglycerol kinase family enzyme